jgi:hypothetical protein
MTGDVLGGFGRLYRQRFHFGRDHGKALAGLACTRRLDGGVERKQIRLPGNVADQLDHVADLLRAVRKTCNFTIGRTRLVSRKPDDIAGLR